jgi:hypothetical protein
MRYMEKCIRFENQNMKNGKFFKNYFLLEPDHKINRLNQVNSNQIKENFSFNFK